MHPMCKRLKIVRFLDLSRKVVSISGGMVLKRADAQHELRNGWGAPMHQPQDSARQTDCLIEDEEPREVA